jgi:CelD/BcsL family acetyltransferase involved in cellulose biosynthesis
MASDLRHRETANVVHVDTRHDPRWRRFVASRPSDVFHSPAWHAVLHDSYALATVGHLLVDADGVARGGLATCHLDDLKGERLVSLPFSDHCDPLVDDAPSWSRLVAALPPLRFRLRTLRAGAPGGDATFEPVGKARWHGVVLDDTVDDLPRGVDGGARRAIRKAQASGLVVRATATEHDVRAFFELHLGVRRRKYRMLAQPYRFFEAIRERFLVPGDGTLLVAEAEGRLVAGVLLLSWRDRLFYKFNASDPDALALRPNDLLMAAAIRHGVERGATLLDLGLSDWDQEGLIRYKRKYAQEERTISFLERPCPSGITPGGDVAALFPALTRLLTDERVPSRITERAGDLLYRYFT